MKRAKGTTPKLKSCLAVIDDDSLRLTIPIGPRFQADIPDWIGKNKYYSEFSKTEWLGVQVWPTKGKSLQTEGEVVGKGRPSFCPCASPGSIDCVKCHINDRRFQLQFDLGPAFSAWKFNEMGEDLSKSWILQEQQEFDRVVKMNPLSQGKSFLKPALERLPTKRVENIISYYFNVYVPRRIKIQTRAGCGIVDTDDDEDFWVSCAKNPRKRCRADSVSPTSYKYVKNKYLTGRR